MNRWIVSGFALFVGTVIAGTAAGCSPNTSAPTLAPRLTDREVQQSQRVSVNLAPPTPVLEPFTDTACLDCHTDQQRLTTLAVGEEKDESLSSGPG